MEDFGGWGWGYNDAYNKVFDNLIVLKEPFLREIPMSALKRLIVRFYLVPNDILRTFFKDVHSHILEHI